MANAEFKNSCIIKMLSLKKRQFAEKCPSLEFLTSLNFHCSGDQTSKTFNASISSVIDRYSKKWLHDVHNMPNV